MKVRIWSTIIVTGVEGDTLNSRSMKKSAFFVEWHLMKSIKVFESFLRKEMVTFI